MRVVIAALLLYGATGDLAGRYLLPALAVLGAAGKLPEDFRVIATARQDLDDAGFRELAAEHLEEHAADTPGGVRETLLRSLHYRPAEVDDPESVARLLDGIGAPVAAYLALPPDLFAPAITALEQVGLTEGSRIAIEKPFGESLEDAVALNALLARVSGDAGEGRIFRVDHVLGMATVQNLLHLRFANRVLAALWNSQHIEQVEVLWEETLGLEGRASFYDSTGALKDVMQNHMMQVFSLLAMEPPATLDQADLRARKVEVLRAVRTLTADEAGERTRRARYTAGRLARSEDEQTEPLDVPDYAAEDGVDPARGTETFAEVTLDVDNPRWRGTQFVLRAGKALRETRKGVVVRFRPFAGTPLGDRAAANELWIGLDGPKDIALHLTASAEQPPERPPLVLTGPSFEVDLPAYSRVLLDLLGGENTLSVGGEEAEEAWRIVTPVLRAWADGVVPLEEYPAGSAGPEPRE